MQVVLVTKAQDFLVRQCHSKSITKYSLKLKRKKLVEVGKVKHLDSPYSPKSDFAFLSDGDELTS